MPDNRFPCASDLVHRHTRVADKHQSLVRSFLNFQGGVNGCDWRQCLFSLVCLVVEMFFPRRFRIAPQSALAPGRLRLRTTYISRTGSTLGAQSRRSGSPIGTQRKEVFLNLWRDDSVEMQERAHANLRWDMQPVSRYHHSMPHPVCIFSSSWNGFISRRSCDLLYLEQDHVFQVEVHWKLASPSTLPRKCNSSISSP